MDVKNLRIGFVEKRPYLGKEQFVFIVRPLIGEMGFESVEFRQMSGGPDRPWKVTLFVSLSPFTGGHGYEDIYGEMAEQLIKLAVQQGYLPQNARAVREDELPTDPIAELRSCLGNCYL